MENTLLVFSDDWGRHPSSCQHLIQQLLPATAVTWVNTVGMRPPRLDRMTLARGGEKLRQWLGSRSSDAAAEELPANLTVRNPRMWPWMSHAWDRSLNARLLSSQLRDCAADAVAVTTIPIVADLVARLPARRWVYYCVDDFSVWPGLAGDVLQRMERRLLGRVHRVIAASDNLADAIRPFHDDVRVLTHGVDLDFWQSDADTVAATPHQAADSSVMLGSVPAGDGESPVFLFWGVVDRRMNADWVLALADAMTAGTVRLVGPQQDPDRRLLQHPRIRATGPVPYEQLPGLAASATALIMPYADLPVTRAMQPLKLKEYLATGRPVVAAALPAVAAWHAFLDQVDDQQQFVAATLRWAEQPTPPRKRAQELVQRLAAESWAAKAEEFEGLVVSC